jgi:hypothetical protein
VDIDRRVREYFGPATANDWFKDFNPAAEVARDGGDAVVRIELPGGLSFTVSAATSARRRTTGGR